MAGKIVVSGGIKIYPAYPVFIWNRRMCAIVFTCWPAGLQTCHNRFFSFDMSAVADIRAGMYHNFAINDVL